ncbi:hypothetical protein Tco_0634078 [Tanacetum coccineum]
MSPSMEARIAEYVVAPTPPSPPPSPLSPWSSPLPQIPSPPLPPPPSSLHLPPHVPTSLPLPSSPLPPLPASLFIPPPVDHREDTPEAELPPRKRLCLTALTSRYEVNKYLCSGSNLAYVKRYVLVTKFEGNDGLEVILTRRRLEVLRKFHWMILGGRFNQLSHVSSSLLSKPGDY